ncbi:PP279 [Orf virus]|uniref:PP279 n=1 Tax=Orf virus TaxID=10258 RepID=F1AXI6_ORFV|nr:PP279 [Orf virus]
MFALTRCCGCWPRAPLWSTRASSGRPRGTSTWAVLARTPPSCARCWTPARAWTSRRPAAAARPCTSASCLPISTWRFSACSSKRAASRTVAAPSSPLWCSRSSW